MQSALPFRSKLLEQAKQYLVKRGAQRLFLGLRPSICSAGACVNDPLLADPTKGIRIVCLSCWQRAWTPNRAKIGQLF